MPEPEGLTAALIRLQSQLPRITKTADAPAAPDDPDSDEARDARSEQAFESRYGLHVDGFADND